MFFRHVHLQIPKPVILPRDVSFDQICAQCLFYVVMFHYCFRKGPRSVPIKFINPLHLFAPVLSQKSDVKQLSFVNVVHKCFSFLSFYIHQTIGFSGFNNFTRHFWNPLQLVRSEPWLCFQNHTLTVFSFSFFDSFMVKIKIPKKFLLISQSL